MGNNTKKKTNKKAEPKKAAAKNQQGSTEEPKIGFWNRLGLGIKDFAVKVKDKTVETAKAAGQYIADHKDKVVGAAVAAAAVVVGGLFLNRMGKDNDSEIELDDELDSIEPWESSGSEEVMPGNDDSEED